MTMTGSRTAVAAAAFVAAALASCASPRIAIVPRLAAGEVRTYHLVTDGRSDIDVPGLEGKDSTHVEATVKIQIVSPRIARVTLTPTVFRRDGKSADRPPEERADLTLGPDGQVTRVTPGRGVQPPLGGSAEDLGALLGSSVRRPSARLGDRWRRERDTPAGRGFTASRISALRFVGGRRCAIVSTAARTPSERSRPAASGQALRLSGTETSSSETAFAFDVGFPVDIVSRAEGRYRVIGAQQGTVIIHTTTRVRLVSRTG